jgi:UDP-N-acetylmuramate--alanine ligase
MHVAAGPEQPTRLAVTKALTATRPDHPELAAARAAGLPVEAWQQTVADAAAGRVLVAVAGTHGKSTTAGWLVHVLVGAGKDPAAFVGALLPSSLTGGPPATARIGAGPQFVVEADEYAGNFDAYRPNVAAITNVDWDHPDVFDDLAAVLDAFEAWLKRAPDPTVVVNVADPGARELARRLRAFGGRLVRVGVGASADSLDGGYAGEILAADATRTRLRIQAPGRGATEIDLPTAGLHNAANAIVVAGLASELGLSWQAIAAGLSSFAGVGRRLERKGEAAGVAVYDDYGHHPAAIRATLRAVRQREPDRRVWAVYEPLTYHRTAAMLAEFASALADADGVAIADIWAGRDPDTTVASAAGLAAAISQRRPELAVAAPGSVEATADWLARAVRAGDVVLVMGGGQSYRIGERLLARLRAA